MTLSPRMAAIERELDRPLREVVVEMLEANNGNSTSVARELSERLGRPISASTVRWWILRLHIEVVTSRTIRDPFRPSDRAADDAAAVAAS